MLAVSSPSLRALGREVVEGFEQTVDLFLGRVVEEAGSHRAAAFGEAEGADRLERVVVAVPDVEPALAQQLGHRARVAALDVEAEGGRAALGRPDPIELDAVGQSAQEAGREAGLVLLDQRESGVQLTTAE